MILAKLFPNSTLTHAIQSPAQIACFPDISNNDERKNQTSSNCESYSGYGCVMYECFKLSRHGQLFRLRINDYNISIALTLEMLLISSLSTKCSSYNKAVAWYVHHLKLLNIPNGRSL